MWAAPEMARAWWDVQFCWCLCVFGCKYVSFSARWSKMTAWSFHRCLFTVVRSVGFGTRLLGQVPAPLCAPSPWHGRPLPSLPSGPSALHRAHASTCLRGCQAKRVWVSSAWHGAAPCLLPHSLKGVLLQHASISKPTKAHAGQCPGN